MPRLEFQAVRKAYLGGIVAVDGVDLAVESGELFVIVGPFALGQMPKPPQSAYDRPADSFVARFIGQPPMNLLPFLVARQCDVLQVWIIGADQFGPPLLDRSTPGLASAFDLRPRLAPGRPRPTRCVYLDSP